MSKPEPLPPPRKPDPRCRERACLGLPKHGPGLCGLAKVVRDHTRTVEHLRIVRDREQMRRMRGKRWRSILQLPTPGD